VKIVSLNTHMSHDIEYVETMKYLPDNIGLAYDGLKVEIR